MMIPMTTTMSTEPEPVDIASILYSFVLALGTGQFVVNEATELAPQVVEIDVETMGLRENKRFILLIEQGKVTQQARVPLTEAECQSPN